VAHPEVELLAREPQFGERVRGVREDFGVGRRLGRPEDIDVGLGELAEPTLLDRLVPPERPGREPLHGFRELLLFFDYHPRDGRGELRRHRHVATALVGERVELLFDLRTALVDVHLGAFEGWRPDLAEPVACGSLFERVDDGPPRTHLARIEIAKPLDAIVHTGEWRARG
jgi:hypothetical protein